MKWFHRCCKESVVDDVFLIIWVLNISLTRTSCSSKTKELLLVYHSQTHFSLYNIKYSVGLYFKITKKKRSENGC